MKISKLLSILLVLALMLCLLPSAALADPEDGKPGEEQTEPEPEDTEPEGAEPEAGEDEPEAEPEDAELPLAEEDEEEEEPKDLLNGEDEVCYPVEGETVYNNGGTVYNNGGTVYNNGGLVYQNSGTVYNNGGTVYANGGVIYNNGGTVYRNSGTVYTFENDVEDSHIYGAFRVTVEEGLEDLVEIEGLDENGFLPEGEACTIRPRDGLVLKALESSVGLLTENEDGSWTLAELDDDAVLTPNVQTLAPVFDLEAGCYSKEQTLTITGPEGAELYYTLDGKEPDMGSNQLYTGPIALSEGCTVTAVALLPGARPSEVTKADFAFLVITAPSLPDGAEGEDPPAAVAFTVENPGTVKAVIESVALSGKGADSFTLSTEKGATIRAGKSDSKTWTLQPAADLSKGSYKVTVVFTLEGGHTAEFEIRYTVK